MPPGAAPFFRTRAMWRTIQAELRCPHCGRFHVDYEEWAHKPHHTHLCEHCLGEFERGTGHVYYSGVPPRSIRGRVLALAHKAQDILDYVITSVTTKW